MVTWVPNGNALENSSVVAVNAIYWNVNALEFTNVSMTLVALMVPILWAK